MKRCLVILISIFIFWGGCKNMYPPELLLQDVNPKNKKYYENFIIKNSPTEEAFIAVQKMAKQAIDEKKWNEAAAIFEKYKANFPSMKNHFEKIIDMLNNDSEKLNITNLGDGINTKVTELAPIPTLDGSSLYFARIYPKENKYEDVWLSTKKDGKWQKAVSFLTINTNTRISGVSTDGNELLIHLNGDIKHLEIRNDSMMFLPDLPVNTLGYESDATFSPDNRAILFCSDRIGNIGDYRAIPEKWSNLVTNSYNTDIYVIVKTDSGWSQPINLGNKINTPWAERSPYLAADGKTLYFSSSRHYGLGGFDVFKSERLKEDSWTEWSEPVNLGKELNSSNNDFFYSIYLDGSVAYFSSDKKGGYGGSDIYSISLPKFARPEPVATITGKVNDDNNNFFEADIIWEDLETKKQMGKLRSKSSDGSYIIVLPLGKKYGYYAEKDGYFPKSEFIDLSKETKLISKIVDIKLIKKEQLINKPVVINNIFFDFNSEKLNNESFPELDRLALLLQEYPNYKVEISGHTDNVGNDEYNLNLSEQRARAVVDYLIFKGLSPDRIIAKGYGNNNPLVNNDSEENRAKNRRVEFKILK